MTNRSRWFFAPATLFLAFFFPPIAFASPLESIFISEMNWAGSERSLADEWIELTNASDESADISGWSLEGAGASGATLTLPVGSSIAPLSTFLISNYSDADEKSCLAAPASYVTTTISLSNSALGITLRSPDGSVRDIAGNGRTPLAGSAGGSGGSLLQPFASMVRRADGVNGAAAESWTSSEIQSGFDDEANTRGTPGSIEQWFVPTPLPESIIEVPIEEPPIEELTPEPIVEVPQETPTEPPEETPTEPMQETPTETTNEELPAESITETLPEAPPETPAELLEENPSAISVIETMTVLETTQETPEPETPAPETSPLTPSVPSTPSLPNLTYPLGTLIVNELYPRPKADEDEWVEVCNPYNNVIPLGGWSVIDGSEHKTSLPSQYLGMDQCVIIRNPSGKLNNDGDAVTILDPAGNQIDVVAYEKSAFPTGETVALARIQNGVWKATITPTPGEQNVVTPIPELIKIAAVAPPTPTKIIISGTINDPAPNSVTAPIKEKPVSKPIGPLTVRISELYPNTSGNDTDEEFIELENWGLDPVDLSGWMLGDATTRRYTEKESVILPPLGTLAFSRKETQIVLNNTSDAVRLYAPNNQLIDEQAYDKAPKGSSKARVGDVWDWTTNLTPDEPNRFSTPAVDARGGSPARGASTASATPAVAKKISKRAFVSGIVVALPEQPGSKAIILDGNSPITLSKTQGTFPLLELGDEINTTGIWQKIDGETVFRVWVTDTLSVAGKRELPERQMLDSFQISETDAGRLLRVEGTIASRTKSAIALEKEGQTIVLDSLEPMPALKIGAKISAAGIVRDTTGGRVLTLGSPAAIEEITPSAADPASGKKAAQESDKNLATAVTAASVLTMIGLAIKHFFF